jgi:hypothetical protein
MEDATNPISFKTALFSLWSHFARLCAQAIVNVESQRQTEQAVLFSLEQCANVDSRDLRHGRNKEGARRPKRVSFAAMVTSSSRCEQSRSIWFGRC